MQITSIQLFLVCALAFFDGVVVEYLANYLAHKKVIK